MSQNLAVVELQKIVELLQLEYKEQKNQTESILSTFSLSQKIAEGYTIHPIQTESINYDSRGRVKVKFNLPEKDINRQRFQQGAMACLFKTAERIDVEQKLFGTISRLTEKQIEIQFTNTDFPDWAEEGKLGLDSYFDEHSYQEMNRALEVAINARANRLSELRDILVGDKSAVFSKRKTNIDDNLLNDQQKQAVQTILQSEDVAVVHGPPGTGKTRTILASLQYLIADKKKILLIAPSNTAVDVLLGGCAARQWQVVRIGNPVRIADDLKSYALETKVINHPDYSTVKKYKSEAEKLRKQGRKYKRNFGARERQNRKNLYTEAREVLQHAHVLEANIEKEILDNSDIICATPVGITSYASRNLQFSIVFIDEASQCLEPACWIALLRSERVVLVGDHQQLPPVIHSQQALEQGLATTLFAKAIEKFSHQKILLNIQYRMNEAIMGFSGKMFYQKKLIADTSVKKITLQDFMTSSEGFYSYPLRFIDTAGYDAAEQLQQNATSFHNTGEALLIEKILEEYRPILTQNIEAGILSPYRGQVQYLQSTLNIENYNIEIDTIDSFQGREKQMIIISLVRSNDEGEIGFLSDIRRMNVAMTRAKRLLLIIGDSSTIGQHPFYSELLSYVEQKGYYSSAWEY